MEVNLCDRFVAFTPLQLRREKAREVFILIKRFNIYSKKQKKKKKKIIKKPAGDSWF
jgi:hypothetical protein